MDTNNNEKQLSMAECRKNGLLWVDTGENMNQQVFTRGLCQDFNQTRPTETEKKWKYGSSFLLPAEKISGSNRLLPLRWVILLRLGTVLILIPI